jgi:predicted LPLAT superfamily acyltransferase
MNFARFYDTYNPGGKLLLGSKWGRIDTWVNLAKDNGYNRLRILTSMDDFLNVPEVFQELHIEEERLLLIPFGGHWGIRGFGTWFDKLFDLAFGPKI